ncbi:MAG TPA: DUF1080 domain-containing protein [Verrucomicrobia bacterium]|nr:DUF1080 domain-containing protein [Verrucomicrobiota bacterium]HOP97362.1 DUF1080 domain-containing protein [Verrucomicrobiota bacterium]HPU56932.1 DUF1080 domain-containing protein [Verrucomicrobiota bacterium]
MRLLSCLMLIVLALEAPAAERVFDFGDRASDTPPPGFRSIVAGAGTPGAWQILLDDVPPLMPLLSSKAPVVTQRAVLAQTSRDATSNRFPILLWDEEEYGDFTFKTRFKIVGGAMEQMAGVVFRYRNASNFYVVRASVLGRNFRCYKVEDGVIRTPIGPELDIAKNTWHELSVHCEGTRIVCSLNGQELIKLVDSTFAREGKIGFWTMSDSVSYFADARIQYKPLEKLVQTLVRDTMKQFPRLVGLSVYGMAASNTTTCVASSDESELGRPGTDAEKDVIENGRTYYKKSGGVATVTLPLRDRNGEPVAAVRVMLDSFPGQTQQNALIRAQPVLKAMQTRTHSREELFE